MRQERPRRRIGGAGRWAVGLALGVCLAAATARAQLQLDAPRVPERFYRERIERIEAEVADLIETERTAAGPAATTAAARKHLRLIARRLYEAGRDAGAAGRSATFYAETLRRRFAAFDAAVGSLPAAARAALAAEERGRIDRLAEAVRGLERFNRRAAGEVGSLRGAEAGAVDAYLQRLLGPLLPLAAGLELPKPAPTWVAARASGERAAGVGVVREGDLAALEARLLRTALPEPTRRQFEAIAGQVRRGLEEAGSEPQAAGLVDRLAALLTAVERFEGAGWVSASMRDRVREQAHRILVLMGERATRASAVERLDRLAALGRLVERIGALAALAEAPVEPLRQALRAAQELSGSEAGRATADRLIGLLDRLAAAARAYRGRGEARLPADLRRVERLLARRYAALEGQVLDRLPLLAAEPEAAAQPRFTEPIAQLERLARQVEYLHRIPGWVDRVAAIHPAAGRRVYPQLRRIAEDLLDPALGAGATAALGAMEQQLELFERLPHEAAFREAEAGVRGITGEAHAGMLAQVEAARRAWAEAWATGTDPTGAGGRLLVMRRLFEALADAARLSGSNGRAAAARLNRWAGWELPAELVAARLERLRARLGAGARRAAAGEFEALGSLLDGVDREAATPWLIAALLDRLDATAAGWPEGLSGLLGQCVYPPTDAAFAVERRRALAAICVLTVAAESAESAEDAEPLRMEAARLADEVRAAIGE